MWFTEDMVLNMLGINTADSRCNVVENSALPCASLLPAPKPIRYQQTHNTETKNNFDKQRHEAERNVSSNVGKKRKLALRDGDRVQAIQDKRAVAKCGGDDVHLALFTVGEFYLFFAFNY